MDMFDVQRLLASIEKYDGAIDGIIGRKSLKAIDELLNLSQQHAGWDNTRKAIAAGQKVLNIGKYYTGKIDGLVGNLTTGALLEWNHQKTYGKHLVLEQNQIGQVQKNKTFPLQKDCNEFYGIPGVEIAKRLVTIFSPFPMILDYDKNIETNKISLHERCADSAQDALDEIYKVYGFERLKRLELNQYAGAYNHRRMRGGTSWSMHAYGCAIDWNADKNGLTTRCPNAQFCKPEYDEYFDIWESRGWVSLGRAIGRDWMHIQAARL